MAVSWLFKVFGKDFIKLDLDFLHQIDPEKTGFLTMMIEKKINCPLTSGTGRLFDAVSALLGLCHVASFPAEGPMRLESLVKNNCTDTYPFTIDRVIRFDETLRELVDDILRGTDHALISTKFHNTIISVIFEASNLIRKKAGNSKVALSGGVFQNKYLLEGTMKLLTSHNFEVYTHSVVPANDGGIALGQLAIASKRRERGCV
jgi:hydrogenase maturation protein HypF